MKQFIQKSGIIGGILYGLSYPLSLNMPTGILAWFALVPMLLSLRDVTTFKQFCFKTLPVLFIGTYIFGAFVFSFGFVAGLITCFSQCILTFLPLIVHYFIQKQIGWRRSMGLLPLVWTIGDWGQHLMPHSFQISSIAYTQTTVLWFAQLADIFGMWGITFWVILINVSIALTIDNLNKTSARFQTSPTLTSATLNASTLKIDPLSIFPLFIKKWAFQALFLFGLPLIYAFWSNLNLPDERSIKVALIQTNEDNDLF